MSETVDARRAQTSISKDFFEMALEATDMMSVWWQPVLKGFGRTQLEIAGLQSRNMQAAMAWGRAIATARQPDAILRANYTLYSTMLAHFEDAAPRVSIAMKTAAEPVVGVQLLAVPVKRQRDELIVAQPQEKELRVLEGRRPEPRVPEPRVSEPLLPELRVPARQVA